MLHFYLVKKYLLTNSEFLNTITGNYWYFIFGRYNMINRIVSFEQLINIKETIKVNSEKYEQDNNVLESRIYNIYDVLAIKKDLISLFEDFKNAKYLYTFPSNTKITSNYDYGSKVSSFSSASKIENAIERKIDKQLLTTEIYDSIIGLSYKLTGREAIYLINTFLNHKSEEEIAYMENVSKTYLQKIKKSCIVKMWIDLRKYCE